MSKCRLDCSGCSFTVDAVHRLLEANMNLSVLIYSTILALMILLVDIVWGVSVNIGTIRSFGFPYTPVQSNLEHLRRNSSVDGAQRQNVFELLMMNGFFNLFAPFINTFNTIRRPNPDRNFTQEDFTSCLDRDGLMGNCLPATICQSHGGRPSGTCRIAAVCCINSISKCGERITLNNTIWKNPPAISSSNPCNLTIALDRKLVEQRVYLEAPSFNSELWLLFKFGVSTLEPKWNIKISLIPCDSAVIAPRHCLQYFTKSTGSNSVKSFNWKDTTGTHQLIKMDYKICFRNELVNNQRATRICYSQCPTQAGGRSFLLSGLQTDGPASKNGTIICPYDSLLIRNGFNPLLPADVSDRYCGGALNPSPFKGPAVKVCSNTMDFNIIYHTHDVKGTAENQNGKIGFCLNFEQTLA
uniref:CUB domain-containing protein n=1 Tax=Daphnia galeata TaxID=27404 RepID=A0A8J2WF79_9CRUS|nr:unnamed protein product [Daphnia galeata]